MYYPFHENGILIQHLMRSVACYSRRGSRDSRFVCTAPHYRLNHCKCIASNCSFEVKLPFTCSKLSIRQKQCHFILRFYLQDMINV